MKKTNENNEQQAEYTTEWYEKTLGRLRKRLTYEQDAMDITSFAIRSLERDLQQLKEEEKALEKDA